MTEEELVEGSGGWMVPESPDYDGFVEALVDKNFTFRRISGGAHVFLSGKENGKIDKIAARHGFTIQSVEVVDGPHSALVRVTRKKGVRHTEDGMEHTHRVSDEE